MKKRMRPMKVAFLCGFHVADSEFWQSFQRSGLDSGVGPDSANRRHRKRRGKRNKREEEKEKERNIIVFYNHLKIINYIKKLIR